MATSGRLRASATVSQVWAFWAPPWISTSSAGASPHTSALMGDPDGVSTCVRRTGRGSKASPTSAALSASIENSS